MCSCIRIFISLFMKAYSVKASLPSAVRECSQSHAYTSREFKSFKFPLKKASFFLIYVYLKILIKMRRLFLSIIRNNDRLFEMISQQLSLSKGNASQFSHTLCTTFATFSYKATHRLFLSDSNQPFYYQRGSRACASTNLERVCGPALVTNLA